MDFEGIYKTSFKNVYRFFYYRLNGSSDVEDICHEVFMRFYTRYKDTNLDETEARKILYGYCRNVYKETIRKSYKENSSEYNDDLNYSEAFEDFSDAKYEKRREEQKVLLNKALEQLSPNVRFVIEARFFQSMSRKDIAARLGISEKDVHTYQKRGIKYLNKIINSDGNIEISRAIKGSESHYSVVPPIT